MCGRFAQSQPVIHYAKALDPKWQPPPLELAPAWNMAPGRDALVFHDDEKGHVTSFLHWGFLPSWADPTGQKPINARVETAASKPYFRKAWKSGRCLIPADGWYEWKQGERSKQPYFIHRADNEPVLMAGLYESNPHANITTFTILTMDSTGALREIHEREPLVLSAEAGLKWVRRDTHHDEIAALATHALTFDQFAWHPVSTRVNNARNEGAELVEPI